MIGTCGESGCLEADVVFLIFGALGGLWALGFSIGSAVALVRRIRNAV